MDASSARRITIADVAREAQVSTASVSYALNGLPGVSAATRERVLEASARLGWSPTSAARSLAGAGAETIGLVLSRAPRDLGVEPFYMQFLSGVEQALAARSFGLLLQIAPDRDSEVGTIEKWRMSRRVDGVLLTDVGVDDPRIALSRLDPSLPTVVVGDPSVAQGLSCVWTDDATPTTTVIDHLARLGHRRVTRIAAPGRFAYTSIRDRAFEAAALAAGMHASILHTDLTPDSGARETRALLASSAPPTAIVFDNDVMAVAALTVVNDLGLSVPGDVSIVAWDDSPLCSLVTPAITAVGRDIAALGAHAAGRLLELIDGAASATFQDATPTLRVRASTGRARD